MNLYGFGGGDPVNFSDPFGLWKTGVHDWLIARALANVVGAGGIRTIQDGSRSVDSWYNQGSAGSFMHSMKNPFQSGAEAIAERDAFVDSRLADARSFEAAGHHDQALAAFGEAIHPLMDSTSPEHTNGDGSPRTWNLMGYSSYQHYKAEGRPTAAQRDATTKMIKEKYESVFGKP